MMTINKTKLISCTSLVDVVSRVFILNYIFIGHKQYHSYAFVASPASSTIAKQQSQRQQYVNKERRLHNKHYISKHSFITRRTSETNFRTQMSFDSYNLVEEKVELSTGVKAEVLSCRGSNDADNKLPPLYFLHGSFHGGWCWTEKYFPYFDELGYPELAALSWRGTGGTFAGDGVKKTKISEHVADLDAFLLDRQRKRTAGGQLPILISHSFGGLAVMKYLEAYPQKASQLLSGVIFMCSVPPSGNGKMTMRYLTRSLVDSYKITVGFAMKKCLTNEDLCRELFFGGKKKINEENGAVEDDYGVSDEDIRRYQRYFKRDSEAPINLFDLRDKLPSMNTDDDGRALYLPDCQIPVFVIGATDDFIVDREALEETANYFGLDRKNDDEPFVLVESPHDVMLGGKWGNGADAINKWIVKNII